MIFLTNPTHRLAINLDASGVIVNYVVSYVDLDTGAGTFVPGSEQGVTSTGGATFILSAPASGVQRQIKYISIANASTTTSIGVIVQKEISGTYYDFLSYTLEATKTIEYSDNNGFSIFPPSSSEEGAGVTDGDKGNITVSGSGTTWLLNTPTAVPSYDNTDKLLLKDTSTGTDDYAYITPANLIVGAIGGGSGGTGLVQYNTAGEFSGDSNFTYNNSTGLSVLSRISVGGLSSGPGEIRYLETSTNGSNYVKIIAPASVASDKTATLQDISGTILVTGGSDVTVADGGTGRSTSTTAYGIIAAGTTATGAHQTISPGTVGQILRSAGASALPTMSAGVPGTTTNNNATAGDVGEYVSSTVSSVALTSTVSTNVTSISLTAGDWFVFGSVQAVAPSSGTTYLAGGISTTSATLPPVGQYTQLPASVGTAQTGAPLLPIRVSIASTTTVYLVGNIGYAGTLTAAGGLFALRTR